MVRIARANGSKVVVIPGDATWDATLAAHGNVDAAQAKTLWAYLVEGGAGNLADALRFCAWLIGEGYEPEEARALPSAGVYAPAQSSERPTAAIVFYRALMQAGQTEPIDALCEALRERGLDPLPLFVSSLKAKEDAALVADTFAEREPAVVLNATSFALSQPGAAFEGTVLDGGTRPVIQVTFAGISEESWASSTRGLAPTDLTMNVVLPEVDGRIISRAVSFKEAGELDPLTECRPVRYKPKADRVAFVAELAARWARLRATPNAEKRIAIVLSNYPNKDGRIANGVGLDAPASTANVLNAMRVAGYDAAAAPETGAELMEALLAGPTNGRNGDARTLSHRERVAAEQPGEGLRRQPPRETADAASPHPSPSATPSPHGRRDAYGEMLVLDDYRRHFALLPESVRAAVVARWGDPSSDPFVENDAFILAAHRFGNIAIGIQPARGYNVDPKTSYHDPDLVPPHSYFAIYFWLREEFSADALIHMGKHGNLEWLPGKALALSESCYPEATLGALPVIYPFIVNDPGEGAQAKRRTAAVVVDHLMPPMARAESYGPAAALEALIDEYAAAEASDPRRAKRVGADIADLAARHGFDKDLGLDFKSGGTDALGKLDAHICDLKELQIRDGLHVLGEVPSGRQRAETLVALARVPRGPSRRRQSGASQDEGGDGDASLLRALADDLELGFDPLNCDFAETWQGPRPASLPPCGRGTGRGEGDSHNAVWRTVGDTVERLEGLALSLTSSLVGSHGGGLHASPLPVPPPQGGRGPVAPGPRSAAVIGALANDIAPALDSSGAREIAAVLDALSGKFVPPGPSGAPTRGRSDCLPTGRNFYSVDVRAVPTHAAFDLGRRSADLLAQRYFQDEGEWPRAIALTVWGTSNMRTGGDDIAQALWLIGARPVWDGTSGRVTGVEVVSLAELKRPRVDVTLRISGFFRDAFPTQISLFHEAVQAVAERDEPADANPIAARIRTDAAKLAEAGMTKDEARSAASFRVFGSKPGAYGAGLQALIDEGVWADRKDLAAAFLEWSAYAYGGGAEGKGARQLLEARLKATDAVVQNQDNREHDLLDSDDYYQFEGGLSASVETLKGEAPRVFHNDHSRPERPVIRALDEEIARVVRGRAANPKWIAGVMRHGYKGAFEIAATVDYLFAFAATTNAVKHHHFEQLHDAYIEDEAVRGFIAENNAPALKEIAARFCEAIDRGLWAPRRNSAYQELQRLAGRMAA